ncbi:MAG TPA: slipin family protein [Telluria sp.]|nr:slipin family protein [Telluria sp.]
MPLIVILFMALLALVLSGLRIANQYERAVVFRLGRFQRVAGPGLFWMIPFIEWNRLVDLRTITASVQPQETITKDNVPVKINAVVWYQTVDPVKAVIDVRDVDGAVIQVALTSLRTLIGRHTLDEVLKDQDQLAGALRAAVDAATEPWGVQVSRVEMRNVEIPESMQRAMAQEAEALREKRARIIKAEAELEASEKLKSAARLIMEYPAGLELRRMQMLTEIGAEQNTSTVVMIPSEFVSMARNIAEVARKAA